MAAERRARTNLYVGPKEYKAPEELDAIEAAGLHLFEEKHDGFWCLARVSNGRLVEASSRVGLVLDAPGLVGEVIASSGSGLLVGELTADRNENGERVGTRRLNTFDIIEWNSYDLRDLPQVDRRAALEMVYSTIHEGARDVVRLVEQRTTGISAWFWEIINRNGEGLVGKLKTGKYRAPTADGKTDTQFRCKVQRTVDYVVMSHGFAEKGTPNVVLGLYRNGKLTKACTVTLPGAWEKLGSIVGSVVEARGWEVFSSGALRSAHIDHRPGPRTDKLPTDCTYESAMKA